MPELKKSAEVISNEERIENRKIAGSTENKNPTTAANLNASVVAQTILTAEVEKARLEATIKQETTEKIEAAKAEFKNEFTQAEQQQRTLRDAEEAKAKEKAEREAEEKAKAEEEAKKAKAAEEAKKAAEEATEAEEVAQTAPAEKIESAIVLQSDQADSSQSYSNSQGSRNSNSRYTPQQIESFYQLLELPKDADKQALGRAYRKLALKVHPDKNPSPDATKEFLKLKEAYDALNEIIKESTNAETASNVKPVTSEKTESEKSSEESAIVAKESNPTDNTRAYHCQVLGLPENADADAIRSAYLNLARKFHPDKNPSPDAPAKFKAIKKAYDELTKGNVAETASALPDTRPPLNIENSNPAKDEAIKRISNDLEQQDGLHTRFINHLEQQQASLQNYIANNSFTTEELIRLTHNFTQQFASQLRVINSSSLNNSNNVNALQNSYGNDDQNIKMLAEAAKASEEAAQKVALKFALANINIQEALAKRINEKTSIESIEKKLARAPSPTEKAAFLRKEQKRLAGMKNHIEKSLAKAQNSLENLEKLHDKLSNQAANQNNSGLSIADVEAQIKALRTLTETLTKAQETIEKTAPKLDELKTEYQKEVKGTNAIIALAAPSLHEKSSKPLDFNSFVDADTDNLQADFFQSALNQENNNGLAIKKAGSYKNNTGYKIILENGTTISRKENQDGKATFEISLKGGLTEEQAAKMLVELMAKERKGQLPPLDQIESKTESSEFALALKTYYHEYLEDNKPKTTSSRSNDAPDNRPLQPSSTLTPSSMR